MDTAPTQEMLGDYLRRERESRLISAAAASKALKVDPSWIQALERNDYQTFPNKKDIPDFLRRYAKFLLIDADDLIRRYEAKPPTGHAIKSEDVPPAVPESPKIPAGILKAFPGEERPPLLSRGLWFAAFGVAIAVPVVVAGIYAFFYREPVKVLKDDLRRMEKSVESRIERPSAPREKVVGNRDSRRYHLPGMKYYGAVDARHRVLFNSEAEAVAAGYHKAPR